MLVKHNNRHTWYGEEITQAKYEEILSILRNCPAAPEGCAYRLTKDLVWEQYEPPTEETVDEEATTEDYEAALGEMGVEV